MGRNIVLIRARKAFKLIAEEKLSRISQTMAGDQNEGLSAISYNSQEFIEPDVSDAAA